MSESVNTVVIATKNGPVTINESDFDPKVHKIHSDDAEPVIEFDRKAAKDYLNALGVQFAKNIGDESLAKLVEETKAKMQ